jgi:AraC-like DNA-binding protein
MYESRTNRLDRRDGTETSLNSFPWEIEREALALLERLDLVGCREGLRRLTESLERNGTTDGREEALYLFDVLRRVQLFLSRAPTNGQDETAQRAAMLRALSRAPDGRSLRLAFHEQVDALLDPFVRGAAALNPVVERARSFIEENCTRKLSLRQIAEHVSVSRNYLSTLFRKQCGCTITAYIHQVRMRRAELLLLAGGHTISEVAYMVGYQNYRDFYRNFVKYTNSSPKRFRQSLGRPGSSATAVPERNDLADRESALPRS